jgi:hypothetical protein
MVTVSRDRDTVVAEYAAMGGSVCRTSDDLAAIADDGDGVGNATAECA